MFCPICRGTGYVTETVWLVHDGGYLPSYIVVNCRCNPAPTDEEYDDSQVPGTAFDDFHRFNDARYAGV